MTRAPFRAELQASLREAEAQIRDLLEEREELLTEIRRLRMGAEEQAILIGWRDAMKWLRDGIESLPAPCVRPDVLAFIDRYTAVDGNYHWPAIRQLVEQRDEWYRKFGQASARAVGLAEALTERDAERDAEHEGGGS